MSTEIWDIFDENGRPTGKTTVRGCFTLKPGEYHLVVHIWILSTDGRFLLQRRSENKKLMPGEWAATGGAAISGEDSFAAASRELFEELGIRSDRDSLKKILRLKRRNSLLDVWMIVTDVEKKDLRLQTDEVAEVCWVSEQKLKAMVNSGEFHNYGKDYFDKVFSEIESSRGAVL